MPKRIFISHSSNDQATADLVEGALDSANYDLVCMRRWRNRVNWRTEMMRAGDDCDHTLALLSPTYFASGPCMDEFNAAWNRNQADDRKVLIPALVAPVELPAILTSYIYVDLRGLTSLAAIVEAVEGAIAEEPPKPRPPLENLPPLPAHALVELPDAVAALDAALAEGAAALSQTIQGLGGVGKTTLAVAYARRPETAARFPVRWWVDAEQGTDRGLAALAAALGLATVETPEAEAVAKARAWLKAPDRKALVIYDNAEEASFDPALLPQSPGEAAALVTTRQRDFHGLPADREVALESWPVNVAAKFLMERSGSEDEAGARALAEALGGLALACEQAGAFCARTSRSPGDYLTLFEANPAKALAWERGAPAYPNSVAKTFALAIEKAAAEVPAAEAMLSVIAHLAPAPVPLAVFGHEAAPEGLRDPMEAAEAEAALTRWALADPAKVTDPLRKVDVPCLSLHRMVREAARARDAGREDAALQDAVRALAGSYSYNAHEDVSKWPLGLANSVHVSVDWPVEGWSEVAAAPATYALSNASLFEGQRGRFESARKFAERALHVDEAIYGPDQPKVAAHLSNLAPMLRASGGGKNLTRAKDVLERAISIGEAAHGKDHPSVAISLSNFASVLHDLGGAENLVRAKDAIERALRIDEAALGRDDPKVAIRLSNLANVLRDLGGVENLIRAKDAIERAVGIGEAVHGQNHPSTGVHLSNLATVLRHLGGTENLKRATDAIERAIVIGEAVHGQNHPSIAISLSNLGNVLRDLGGLENLTRAREALERALRIDEAAYGPDYSCVAIRLSNLAGVLGDLGGDENLTRAREALERALSIDEAAHGPDHPSIGIKCGLLARVLASIGGAENRSQAKALADRAARIHEDALGPDHPMTQTSYAIRDNEIGEGP